MRNTVACPYCKTAYTFVSEERRKQWIENGRKDPLHSACKRDQRRTLLLQARAETEAFLSWMEYTIDGFNGLVRNPEWRDKMVTAKHEYQVVEDNGGGLTLYVFAGIGQDGIDSGRIIWAHSGYEYNDGQLTADLAALDDGHNPTIDWDGGEDDPQAMYDELDKFEHGWSIVCDGYDGKRNIYPNRMGAAAKREFAVVAA